MPYTSTSPAENWFFVCFPVAPKNELIVWRIATWAIDIECNVVGLISVHGGGNEDQNMGRICRLVSPPPLRGVYKHADDLTDEEKIAAGIIRS